MIHSYRLYRDGVGACSNISIKDRTSYSFAFYHCMIAQTLAIHAVDVLFHCLVLESECVGKGGGITTSSN